MQILIWIAKFYFVYISIKQKLVTQQMQIKNRDLFLKQAKILQKNRLWDHQSPVKPLVPFEIVLTKNLQEDQFKQLKHMKSIIQELQDLVTPKHAQNQQINMLMAKKQTDYTNKFDRFHRKQRSDSRGSPSKYLTDKNFRHTINQIKTNFVQDVNFKQQAQKLVKILTVQENKNRQLQGIVAKLKQSNQKMQIELQKMFQKLAKSHDQKQRLAQCEKAFKKQLIVNLQLQEYMVKMRMEQPKLQQNFEKELQRIKQQYKKEINDLNKKLDQEKIKRQQQIVELKQINKQKQQEIDRLKENHKTATSLPKKSFIQSENQKDKGLQLVFESNVFSGKANNLMTWESLEMILVENEQGSKKNRFESKKN